MWWCASVVLVTVPPTVVVSALGWRWRSRRRCGLWPHTEQSEAVEQETGGVVDLIGPVPSASDHVGVERQSVLGGPPVGFTSAAVSASQMAPMYASEAVAVGDQPGGQALEGYMVGPA